MEQKSSSKKLQNIIMTAVFLLFVFGFAAALIIKNDREFSEMENRSLTKKPEVSWENIKEGKFSSDLESYISDQLFAKDALVSVKTDIDRLIGRKLINGVYIIKGTDGRLRYVQRYTENKTQIAENIGYLNEFAEKVDVPVDLMLVPNASAQLLDKLPTGALCDDQRESIDYAGSLLSDKISFYPMTEELAANGSNEDYYFRTDHHWTTLGAWTAVKSYFNRSGQQFKEDANYSTEVVPEFYGTLYSKAPTAFADADDLILSADPNIRYTVEWVNEGKTSDSIIDRSFLDKKDKYAAFFGGNFAQVRITSNNSGGKVLVLKDSYANSAMQYLKDQYSEITMIDLRYYHMQEKEVSELVKEYGCDRVIMLYNMDFLNEDKNFVWLS